MSSDVNIKDISAALRARNIPSITEWNRLEARPRTKDFDRALSAELRDALWMLTRQWQMGEFRGDDAGSPAPSSSQMVDDAAIKVSGRES